MKLLLIVPLIGVVLSAPVAEENVEKSPIVKRAMETIMFGNQQNSNKQVKKSDPSVPLRDDIPDVNAPVLPDDGGTVEADKAEDLPETKPETSNETPENELEIISSPEASDEKSPLDMDTKSASDDEDAGISPENKAAIDELENSVTDNSEELKSTTGDSSGGDALSDNQNYDNYDLYALYKEYQNMLSQSPKYNYYYGGYRRKRRGAIRKRKFMGNIKERAFKRAHRTKRDLTYPDGSDLYDPYYYPDMPYSYSDLTGVGYPYEMEEEPLEELLGDNELPYGLGQYNEPSVYDYRPLRYEEEEEPYLPTKRQSMLSFVPGNRKRSPYFYPISEEPQTHFGAFIPEKRDYFETYGNLVRAARLLAAREDERNALQGNEDWY